MVLVVVRDAAVTGVGLGRARRERRRLQAGSVRPVDRAGPRIRVALPQRVVLRVPGGPPGSLNPSGGTTPDDAAAEWAGTSTVAANRDAVTARRRTGNSVERRQRLHRT
ncbi:hypothetical protein GCM10025868_40820 [Angustibacter aerolatus]|uniref:Uncharacterized protein n=1 Tax=Angustibacter aerolatus TaxID=1162965 RepID=A0ABQ6JPR2_9ACTN|nr:hypothetical protein GCM10025868_40820 [Angustibacter aerolatus]